MYFIILMSLTAMVLSSCRNEGCTNKDAVNFDVTADEDDGSCVVCQTTIEDIAYKISYLKDGSFNSTYNGQFVAKAYLHQFSEKPNDKLCSSAKNNLNIKLKNLMNQTMYIERISVFDYSGPVQIDINDFVHVEIAAGEIVDLGDFPEAILNNPASLPITLDSLRIESNSIIYY
jgi:hypothetical protein